MLIRVKAFPNSKKEEIIKKSENNFEVRVKERPMGGRANRAIICVLSDFFKIPTGKIRLIRGHKEKSKIFDLDR